MSFNVPSSAGRRGDRGRGGGLASYGRGSGSTGNTPPVGRGTGASTSPGLAAPGARRSPRSSCSPQNPSRVPATAPGQSHNITFTGYVFLIYLERGLNNVSNMLTPLHLSCLVRALTDAGSRFPRSFRVVRQVLHCESSHPWVFPTALQHL